MPAGAVLAGRDAECAGKGAAVAFVGFELGVQRHLQHRFALIQQAEGAAGQAQGAEVFPRRLAEKLPKKPVGMPAGIARRRVQRRKIEGFVLFVLTNIVLHALNRLNFAPRFHDVSP